MVTETLAAGLGNGGSAETSEPVLTPGHTPSPVAKIWITVPLTAGLFALLELLSAFRIAPCPSPDWFAEKMAGAVSTTAMGIATEAAPLREMTTFVVVLPAV